jgi:hypothetical protein
VTIQFKHWQSLSSASVIVDLMSGSNVCLQAEGLKLGPGYAGPEPYLAGSTVTVTGNNFEHNVGYPLCGTTSFTTDHLRFQLVAHYPPPELGRPRHCHGCRHSGRRHGLDFLEIEASWWVGSRVRDGAVPGPFQKLLWILS